MFVWSKTEIETVVSQNVIPHKKYLGGATPFVFTQPGVAMLSGVLSSSKGIIINIAIMRSLIALQKIAANYKEMKQILANMCKQYDSQFTELNNALKKLICPLQEPGKRIDF